MLHVGATEIEEEEKEEKEEADTPFLSWRRLTGYKPGICPHL
jgi:hypothetical protein